MYLFLFNDIRQMNVFTILLKKIHKEIKNRLQNPKKKKKKLLNREITFQYDFFTFFKSLKQHKKTT